MFNFNNQNQMQSKPTQIRKLKLKGYRRTREIFEIRKDFPSGASLLGSPQIEHCLKSLKFPTEKDHAHSVGKYDRISGSTVNDQGSREQSPNFEDENDSDVPSLRRRFSQL